MSQATLPKMGSIAPSRNGIRTGSSWEGAGLRFLIDRLGVCECRRRLLHMLPGLLPAVLMLIPHRDPWGWPLIGGVLLLSLTINVFAITRELDFARPEETLWHVSVIGYTAPVVAMLLLFPGKSELGLLTLGVLAFGDGSAALGGKLIGGARLPWNSRKTWAGLCCFAVAGAVAASFSYWSDSRPAVSVLTAATIGTVAALAGAFVESLPIRSHDNFRVGTTAALAGLAMHIMLLGW